MKYNPGKKRVISKLNSDWFVAIHHEFVSLFHGDVCLAAILDAFDYFTAVELARTDNRHEKDIPWVQIAIGKLVEWMAGMYSRRMVAERLQILDRLGILKTAPGPPKGGKVYSYVLDVDLVDLLLRDPTALTADMVKGAIPEDFSLEDALRKPIQKVTGIGANDTGSVLNRSGSVLNRSGSVLNRSYKEEEKSVLKGFQKVPPTPLEIPAPPSGATQDALFEMDAKSAIPEKPKTKPGTIAEEFNEFDIARGEAARNIHQRHPNRRDLSEAKVYSKLEALSKSLAIKKADLVSFARRVDDNHRRWCQSDEWTNHDGQYVKSLSAWLNGKAEAEPPRNSTQEPEYHKPVDFYWLRPRDGEEGEGSE